MPVVDIDLSDLDTVEDVEAALDAWSLIVRAVVTEGFITFYATEDVYNSYQDDIKVNVIGY